ncbi:MAG: tripartite tricarboxylate transporter substrate binding protein [Betaproteobacteria bacterium]|nr:tripartite tricarboxylate transporter substrate binding protein [Betaproteobacteria bacterium]MBI3054234.1 tripartite tricarboxylate transporter substrate binding protein [Betaproteobacteria bacterium]
MKTTRYIVSGLLALACAAGAGAQQAFPNKPIRLVVGFAPGGNTDTVARVVGAKLGERLGTQVIIDNRGGAGGTIGTEIAARANSDGYTLTMGTTTTHAIAVAAYPKLRYDPVKDFEPIALVAIAPYLLVVNQNVPMKSLKEFISHVQSQPGKLNYASAGQATTTHLVMATLQQRAKLDMMHVPFKGNGPATAAVLGGQVQALFGALPPLLPHVQTGRVRALAVSSAKRLPSVPDVPTVAESGFPGFDMTLWLGFFAPKGTPAAVVKRLEAELVKVAQLADVKEQMSRQGLEAHSASAAELGRLTKTEIENYKSVFKTAGIKME